MARPKGNEFKLNYPFAEYLEKMSRSELPIMVSDNNSAFVLGKLAKRTKAFEVMKNSNKMTFIISIRRIQRTSKTKKFAWFRF
jgi:hypothetical protein